MNKERLKVFFNKVVTKLSPIIPSDELYIRLKWLTTMNYKLDLRNPRTYSEKIQWLKLHDRRPEYTTMVDKYAVKEYVAGIIGKEYVIPTLGVWNRPEEIEWDSLPDKFVLKCTHDSGGVVICKDKAGFDKQAAIKRLNKGLRTNYYLSGREWPYKNVPRRIIAEEFIEPVPNKKDLPDYKFFCFDGVVAALFVATERQNPDEEVKFNFFDADFNPLPLRQGHDRASNMPKRPHNFNLMKEAATQLSKGYPHVRVDFYEVGEQVLFGELTLYHFDGMVPFEPNEWDKYFGDMIQLPGKPMGGVIIRQEGDTLLYETPDLSDYKIFCFDGEVKMMYVATERHIKDEVAKFDFFDSAFHHLPVQQCGHPNAVIQPQAPRNLTEMKRLASLLSKGIPHVRIDFYEVGNRILFGEITFFSMSGMTPYSPEEWDYRFGEWIKLPSINKD